MNRPGVGPYAQIVRDGIALAHPWLRLPPVPPAVFAGPLPPRERPLQDGDLWRQWGTSETHAWKHGRWDALHAEPSVPPKVDHEVNREVLRRVLTEPMPPGTDYPSAVWGASQALVLLREVPAGAR